MSNPIDIPAPVREWVRRLAAPKPMRRGSLSVRSLRCNKPGCACATDPDARHGPYTSVVRTVAGRTRSRLVPAAQAELLREQVQAGQHFRKAVEAYWQACEDWADGQLEAAQATSTEAAKKGASKRPSKPRSSPRSKRS